MRSSVRGVCPTCFSSRNTNAPDGVDVTVTEPNAGRSANCSSLRGWSTVTIPASSW